LFITIHPYKYLVCCSWNISYL